MTPDEYARARRILIRRDPILAPIIRRFHDRRLIDAPAVDPFSALVRTIVGQQLSTKAAATIHRRLLELLPDGIATPGALDALTDAQLRQVGMSRQKSAYVRDLSAKAASGELHLDRLAEMTDDQVIEALTKVKGLGRWSAEMFLMFRLRRPDVLPVDDLGSSTRFTGCKASQAPRCQTDPPAGRVLATVSDGGVLVSVEKPGKHAARCAEAGRSAPEADPVIGEGGMADGVRPQQRGVP